MTKIVKLKSGAKLEDVSHYSRLVMVDNLIFVSNTAGRNPDTQEIAEDASEQTRQVFANIERALRGVGSSLKDVVSTRIFIQDPGDTHTVMSIFAEVFEGVDPTTTVSCPPLASKTYKVEIEATAYKGASSADVEYIRL